jgi:ERCC4-type nuclease
MILVDDRVGSVHYAPALNAQIERLEYGDIALEANGKLIGIEIKRISGAIYSLINGRLVDHQLPGMLGMYDHSYLIVEGLYRPEPETGIVQTWWGSSWHDCISGSQKITWNGFEGWLTSIESLAGIRIRRTANEKETVATIKALYHWWSKSEHKSLHVLHTAMETAAIERPGLLRRMAAQLPGIGWDRSAKVASHFGSIRAMVGAGVDDWMEIDGIGKGIATKVVEAIGK